MPSSAASASSAAALVAVLCLGLFAAQCSALIARQSREFPSRFFIPDAVLANQLLGSPHRQFAPEPMASFQSAPLSASSAAFRGRLFKRYFDSLAGQSLGKRSAPAAESSSRDEERKKR